MEPARSRGMSRFWRESAWMWVFAVVTACSGKSSDLFDDAGAGAGSEEEGGAAGDDGAGGSGARDSGGSPGTGGKRATGGAIGVGGVTVAGGAIGVGGAIPAGGAVPVFGGTSPGGAIGVGGVDVSGGMIGVGGVSVAGGAISVGGAFTGGNAGGGRGPTACSDPDGTDYKRRGKTTGTNGTFEDRCEDGNLVEYICELGPCVAMSSGAEDRAAPALPLPVAGGPGIAPPPPQCITGRVVESLISCGGRCNEGTCFGWCPAAGDEVTYEEVEGGEVVLENASRNARYRCEVQSSTGNADCADPELEGETRKVEAIVSCSAVAVSFATRLSEQATCNYRCSIVD